MSSPKQEPSGGGDEMDGAEMSVPADGPSDGPTGDGAEVESMVQGSAVLEVCNLNYGSNQPDGTQPVLGMIYPDSSALTNGEVEPVQGDHDSGGNDDWRADGVWQGDGPEEGEGDANWQEQEEGVDGGYVYEGATTDSYAEGDESEVGRAEGFEQLGLVISGVTGRADWSSTDGVQPPVRRGRGRPRGSRGKARGRGRGVMQKTGRGHALGMGQRGRGLRGRREIGREARQNNGTEGNSLGASGVSEASMQKPGERLRSPKRSLESYLLDLPLLRLVKKAPTASDCYSLNADFAMFDPSSMDQRQRIIITRYGIRIRRVEAGALGSRFTCELCETGMDEVEALRHHLKDTMHSYNKNQAIKEGLFVYQRQKLAITKRRKLGLSTPGSAGRGRGRSFGDQLEDEEVDRPGGLAEEGPGPPSDIRPRRGSTDLSSGIGRIKRYEVSLRDNTVHLEEVAQQETHQEDSSEADSSGLSPLSPSGKEPRAMRGRGRGRGRPAGSRGRGKGPYRQAAPVSNATAVNGERHVVGRPRKEFPQSPTTSPRAQTAGPSTVAGWDSRGMFSAGGGLDACSDDTLWAELIKRRVLYQCSCGFNFDSSARYFLHRASHSTNNERCCSICGTEFSNWIRFHAHFFQHDC